MTIRRTVAMEQMQDEVHWRSGGDESVLLVVGVAADHGEPADLGVRLHSDVVIHG